MMDRNHSSPLLRLPAELRKEIYSYLYYEGRSPPADPSSAGDRFWREDRVVAHERQYSSFRYTKLVWVSRQLRSEYYEYVEEQLKKAPPKAELDLMSKGFLYYPTWTFLPPELLGAEPFDVEVNLRIFSTEAYRSNDGWPRQPGAGFRTMLLLLNQLVHHGPSFGEHFEALRGGWLWLIGKLTVNVSFHGTFVPDTRPGTVDNITKMLRHLALDGLAKDIIRRVHVHTSYIDYNTIQETDKEWKVSRKYDALRAKMWKDAGFLTAGQKTLADDYREDLEDDFNFI